MPMRRRCAACGVAGALTARAARLCERSYWQVGISEGLSFEESSASRGHLEFEQDPADRDAMIADYCEKPGETSRRQIREPEDDAAPATQCQEGYVLVGRLHVKLMSPTRGLLKLTPNGAEEPEELFHFNFSPNLNRLHMAQGPVSEAAQALGYSAFQSTIVAANHLQLTGFGMNGDEPMMSSLSAKKGVPDKNQETFLSKWGPSALVFVFFIGSKFLRKKYGKGSDYMKDRQQMPKPRTMPEPEKKNKDA